MVSRIPEGYRAYDTLRGLSVSGVSAVIVAYVGAVKSYAQICLVSVNSNSV